MSLAGIFTRTAERYALIKCNVITDTSSFTDYNPRAVVNEKSLAYFDGRMNFNARFL